MAGFCLLFAMISALLWIGGILVSIMWMSTHSTMRKSGSNSNKESLRFSFARLMNTTQATAKDAPHWNSMEPFWSPISITMHDLDPTVTLCKLNFQEYSKTPHKYPMFRDLVAMSNCGGSNVKSAKLSAIKADPQFQGKTGRYLEPTGFVFHESRVGSTLVANALACDPWAMVFSESDPLPKTLICSFCSREQSIVLFQDLVRLMSYSTFHRRVFFKFQSVTVTRMDIALAAFPSVPWTFLFRTPTHVLMSHLDPKKGGGRGAPCLRSRGTPEVKAIVESFRGTVLQTHGAPPVSDTVWCACHLHMLCMNAIQAALAYNSTPAGVPRGLLLDYSSLPGSVLSLLRPLFGLPPAPASLVNKIRAETSFYSKGRGESADKTFSGDSQDKETRATQEILTLGSVILASSFTQLSALAETGARRTLPATLVDALPRLPGLSTRDWSSLKPISEVASASGSTGSFLGGLFYGIGSYFGHSAAIRPVQAEQPFGNSHTSRTFTPPECPAEPPPNYPFATNMTTILANWSPDNTEIPPRHYDSLCHFDYSDPDQLAKAFKYRQAEVPFVAYNIPAVDEVVQKWSRLDYLQSRLGVKTYRTETSRDNHFMYWHGRRSYTNKDGTPWTPPTDIVERQFEQWINGAIQGQNTSLEARRHEYFRVSSDMGNPWLFEELPFFKPVQSLFMVLPKKQRGIHCYFGMRSIIAEAHFDGSRNMVAMLGGLRRWILTHPSQCKDMYMLPPMHPSGRHSEIDWSRLDIDKYPLFRRVQGMEVILQPGDVLYVPTFWIHYIVSLNVNYQCNTRSGVTNENRRAIQECGF